MSSQVGILDVDAGYVRQPHRREVENPANTDVDERLVAGARRSGRNRQHGEVGTGLADGGLEIVDVMNDGSSEALAELGYSDEDIARLIEDGGE